MRIWVRDNSTTSTNKEGRFLANYTKLKIKNKTHVFIFHTFSYQRGYNVVLSLTQITVFLNL